MPCHAVPCIKVGWGTRSSDYLASCQTSTGLSGHHLHLKQLGSLLHAFQVQACYAVLALCVLVVTGIAGTQRHAHEQT